ncbi:MAG: YfhO family protein, partial [Acidobacteriota bacterium]
RLLPSMLAAIAFLLSGPLITWGLFPHTAALAFVPWVMLSSLRLARSPSPRRLVLGSLLLAALLLSGHPEVAFVGGLAAATLAVALRRRSSGLQAILAWNAASVLLGLLLASPSLLPFLLQLPEAQRFHEMAEAPHPETAVLGFEPSRVDLLRSLWTPYAYGRPYLDDFAGGSNWAEALSGAPGAIVLLGAVLFLVAPTRRSRPLRHPGPALFVCACWLAAAGWGPLVALLKSLPLLSVLEYRRSLLVVGVLLAVFAAHGLSALLARQGRRTLLLTAVLGALALLMGARDAEPIAWLVLLVAALPWPLGGPRRAALVAAAIVLAQVPWAWRMLPRSAPESFFPTSPLVEKVAARTAVEDGRYRVVGSGYELYPSLLPLWGLDEVRPHNPMAPWAQTELLARTFDFRSQTSSGAYFSAFGHLDDPLLDYLNVGAVIQPAQDAAPEGWPVLAELGNRRAVVNPDALPRWFAPTTWLRAPRRPAGSPARAVTFEGCPELDPLQSERSADPVVLSRDSDDVRLSLGSSFPELLATSVPWSTGWQATSEEGPLQTCRINEAFLGVVVPPGTATLWLRYEPPGLRTGSALSALALVSLGGLWTRRRRPVS